MSAILKDQFALLEARDEWFSEPSPTRCCYCGKRCEPNIQVLARTGDIPPFHDDAEFCCDACDRSVPPEGSRPELVVTPEIMDMHERVQRLELLGFLTSAEALREVLKARIAKANPHLEKAA